MAVTDRTFSAPFLDLKNRFTAPVEGYYSITWSHGVSGTGGLWGVRYNKNASRKGEYPLEFLVSNRFMEIPNALNDVGGAGILAGNTAIVEEASGLWAMGDNQLTASCVSIYLRVGDEFWFGPLSSAGVPDILASNIIFWGSHPGKELVGIYHQ